MSLDTGAVEILEEEGLTWQFVSNYRLSNIDEKASGQVQSRVRVKKLTDEVERYAVSMGKGADFPAIVVWPTPYGNNTLRGGYQRWLAALDAKKKTLDAILITSSDSMAVDIATRRLNVVNGRPEDRSAVVEQAVYVVLHHKLTVKVAAAKFNLPEHVVERALRSFRVRERLKDTGLSLAGITKEAVLGALSPIRHDAPLIEAVKLAMDAGLSTDEAKSMVTDINKQRSESAELDAIRKLRQQYHPRIAAMQRGPGGPRYNSPAGYLLKDLQQATRRIEKAKTLDGLGATPEDREAILESFHELQLLVGGIYGSTNKPTHANGSVSDAASVDVRKA